MTVSIHLVEWLIVLVGLAAAMVPPTAKAAAADGEAPRESPAAFLDRIARTGAAG